MADEAGWQSILAAAGFSASEIIKIATFNGVRFLGKQDQMGIIEEGKLAGAVLLGADPTDNINNSKAIVAVIKAGEIIEESRLPLAGDPQTARQH